MTIWKHVRDAWPRSWRRSKSKTPEAEATEPADGQDPSPADSGEEHLELARESLRGLMHDERVPQSVRVALAEDYKHLQRMLGKLEQGQVQVAVLGRVSVGKSALLNSLLGEERFAVSPLHGETRVADQAPWQRHDAQGVLLIDTPGINEVSGEERERLAHEVAVQAELVLFVVDGDLSEVEYQALRQVGSETRPVLLVLNKADRYTADERARLLETLGRRVAGLVAPDNILAVAARPAERTVIMVDAQGRETETRRRPDPDVERLRERLWELIKAEGKTLAALNAGLFAGRISDRITQEILAIRRELAEKVVRNYCLGKGLAVALNPIPLADLLTVAADAAMIRSLSRVYGLPLTRAEAGRLLRTIIAQLTVLMGTVWGVHLVSSALKGVSLGLSVLVTASAQGAVAWYGTYVVGKAAESYFAQGKSWGEGGPKRTVRRILDSLDQDSLLASAREDILARLRPKRREP